MVIEDGEPFALVTRASTFHSQMIFVMQSGRSSILMLWTWRRSSSHLNPTFRKHLSHKAFMAETGKTQLLIFLVPLLASSSYVVNKDISGRQHEKPSELYTETTIIRFSFGLIRPQSSVSPNARKDSHPNVLYLLDAGGHFVISIKANCTNSTVLAEGLFAKEKKKLQVQMFKSSKQDQDQQDSYSIKGLSYRIPPDNIAYEWLGSAHRCCFFKTLLQKTRTMMLP